MTRQFVIEPSDRAVVPATELASDLPQLVVAAGNAARFAYEEFFLGRIRNPYTRRNYRHAVHRFLEWCQSHGLELHQIAPKHVGLYRNSISRVMLPTRTTRL